MTSKNNSENKKNNRSKLLLIFFIIIIVAVGAFFGIRLYKDYLARREAENLSDYVETTLDDRVFNPVDFAALKKRNPEVYAWIVVPNTDIELPILQSHADDLYYLDRDIDGKKSRLGSIFTQSANKRDFSDPVTLIYGHNYYTGGMFTNLHYFEDKKFFDENEYFYIYTPDRRLTYRIVSAYKYDDRHILNSFDFSDESVRREYFDYTLNPLSMLRNVREGVTLSTDDKLVVLSTCLTGGYSGRYLVSGVLINDEQTK
ncbi:MAG: class B sortase [Clostridia bacterium]|nr:class B sortase [Clostridia bacterium]